MCLQNQVEIRDGLSILPLIAMQLTCSSFPVLHFPLKFRGITSKNLTFQIVEPTPGFISSTPPLQYLMINLELHVPFLWKTKRFSSNSLLQKL